jgi:hypothetical protein
MAAGSTDLEKDTAQLARYESPEQIWKKTRELERKMSSGEYRSQLPKDARPDEVAKWRVENNIPLKAEDYKINMPAGQKPPAEDDAFLKGFLKTAHDSHYTQPQVDSAINSFYAEVDRQRQVIGEQEKVSTEKCEDALRLAWGNDYRPNKAMEEALLARAPAGFRDRFFNGYLADGTKISASPEAHKWLVQMEREINPAATVLPASGPAAGQNLETELAGLKKMMGDDNSAYWKGPDASKNQARYRALVDAEGKMKAKAA